MWEKEGLISRLCIHFILGFASSGWPISFPRSFSPVHDRKRDILMNVFNWQLGDHYFFGKEKKKNNTKHFLTNCSLYLAHDLVVGNCSATLIVCNDLRLLINFLRRKFTIHNLSFKHKAESQQSYPSMQYNLFILGLQCLVFFLVLDCQ